jgi:two-component SAPR family response regulator
MFWYDKSTNSARNNRSVNITKLKSIFEQLSGIQINKDSGNWKIIFEPSQVNIDYFEIQNLTQSKKVLSNSQVKKLLAIINQGSFLSNLEYEWLDDFKGEISNKIIDVLLAYSEQLTVEDDAEKIVEIADNIFKFDSVDEKAMSLKCKSLIHLGKHSLAKSSYEKFAKDYQRLYSEEYTIQYKEFLDL